MEKVTFSLLLASLLFSCAAKNEHRNEGAQSKLVQASQSDTLAFTSEIRAIFQDSKGNYWFGSQNEGLAVFNGTSFSYFTASNGLSDNQIRSFQEDQTGAIWIETANGLSKYDGILFSNYLYSEFGDSQNTWSKTDSDRWFSAGNKAGVLRYSSQQLEYLAFPKPQTGKATNEFFVTAQSKGKNGRVWFATYDGVFGYDGNQFTIITDKTLGLNKTSGILHIRSILEDSKGRLWIGNNGIGVLLRIGESTINFSEKQNLIHPNSSGRGDKSVPGTLEHVFAIEEDAEGNIWFGDRDTGVWKYDGNTMQNFTQNDGLTDTFIRSIYRDAQHNLWFGLADGTVLRFNGKTFYKPF
ncbi:diguanylate cyclase [bacterium]|nr:MAG: diguanylate cyclase [bacterium]